MRANKMDSQTIRALCQEIKFIIKIQKDFRKSMDMAGGVHGPLSVSLRKMLFDRSKNNTPLVKRYFDNKPIFQPLVKPQNTNGKPLNEEEFQLHGLNVNRQEYAKDKLNKLDKSVLLHSTTFKLYPIPGLAKKEEQNSDEMTWILKNPFDWNSSTLLSLEEWLKQKVLKSIMKR